MSELMLISKRMAHRSHLLCGVATVATILFAKPSPANADDSGPTVWLEVGSQLQRDSGGEQPFSPPFVSAILQNAFENPTHIQGPSKHSFGYQGKVSIRPNASEWTFSASMIYGRSNRSGSSHEQTSPSSAHGSIIVPYLGFYNTGHFEPAAERFENSTYASHTTNLIVDFNAGRDVGIGAIGISGSSHFSVGIRFAQFTTKSTASIDSDPDFGFSYKYRSTFAGFPATVKIPSQSWDLFSGKLSAERSFHGVGPSFNWDADATLVGDKEQSRLTIDWGVTGALLFGRQKAFIHHTTMAHHATPGASGPLPPLYQTVTFKTSRSRSVLTPNIGGFAGVSLRFPNAKVSVGYRVDAFFGAIDGGIDSRKTYDRDFYGPFATISVGLGG